MKIGTEVEIERRLNVEINENLITEEVLKQFSETMWPVKDVIDIIKHLSYLAATQDRTIGAKNELIEGLGYTEKFGIKVEIIDENIIISPDFINPEGNSESRL